MALPRFMRAWLVCGLGILAAGTLPSVAHAGSVLYVDDDAAPGGDGISWDSAYRFLQDALTDASGGGITEIRTAQGTYRPDRDEANPDGTGNREATFQLVNGLALMGGYAGLGAPDPDVRDIDLYETILSGDLLGNDGSNFANNDENSYHVTTGSNNNVTAVLDGLIIRAGNADGIAPDDSGGGIYNGFDSPTLTSCTFIDNSASLGGGIYNAGNATLTDCTLVGNSANLGGGLYNIYGEPTLTDCTFSGNFALVGGGMYNRSSEPVLLNACMFSANSAGLGGGVYNDGDPILTDSAFSNNFAAFGGGFYNSGGSPSLTDCTFSENLAVLDGGGLYAQNGNATLIACMFSANTADERGGGIYISDNSMLTGCAFDDNAAGVSGGGMYCLGCSATLAQCTFTGNTAAYGGGMYNFVSSPTVTNCTFSGNSASVFGGGILNLVGGSATVTNCILWNNSPNEINRPATVSYSDVAGGFAGIGNIDADPLFVDPDNGDYHLSPGSPCIDAGDNSAVPKDIVTDLDGNPRFVDDPCTDDTGFGDLPIVDMGAYEFQGSSCDLNGDGSVGILDLLILLGSWGPCPDPPNPCPADLNGDGSVGILDLLMLLANWG